MNKCICKRRVKGSYERGEIIVGLVIDSAVLLVVILLGGLTAWMVYLAIALTLLAVIALIALVFIILGHNPACSLRRALLSVATTGQYVTF